MFSDSSKLSVAAVDPIGQLEKRRRFLLGTKSTLSVPALALTVSAILISSGCAQMPNTEREAAPIATNQEGVVSIETGHEPIATHSVGASKLRTTNERPANSDDLSSQQAIIDKIMSFLKEQISIGEATMLPARAAEVFKVNFRFVANKPAHEGKEVTDFLTDQTDVGNGRPYEGSRVDVYDGGQIPGTIYSTHYKIYSEGGAPKYVDLFLKYGTRNGGVCLNSIEYVEAAKAQGLEPGGGLRDAYALVLFFHAKNKSVLVQADGAGERCAQKLGLRIKY